MVTNLPRPNNVSICYKQVRKGKTRVRNVRTRKLAELGQRTKDVLVSTRDLSKKIEYTHNCHFNLHQFSYFK